MTDRSPFKEKKPSKLRRCFDWDYRRPGTYIVTLTLADRSRDWLGWLGRSPGRLPSKLGNTEGLADTEGFAGAGLGWRVELTELGRAVERCWREIGEIWPGVEPRELQIMPEHLHGILRVVTAQRHPLGQIIGSFKARATAAAREIAEQARQHEGGQARQHEGLPRVGELARRFARRLLAGESLWSPGFQDTILWDLKRYRAELNYLLDNPRRLAIKRAHPDFFRVVRDLAVPLAGGIAHFNALGNPFLLTRPLVQVQCSRRDFRYRRKTGGEFSLDDKGEKIVELATSAFDARTERFARAADEGAVLISPCISEGERELTRRAFARETPLVVLKNVGFASCQKPSGRLFEACAEGRLLLLAPAAWPYQPGHKPMTRDDATAMNRLCQWLAGDGAAAINYHGVMPVQIDAAAKRAVLWKGFKS